MPLGDIGLLFERSKQFSALNFFGIAMKTSLVFLEMPLLSMQSTRLISEKLCLIFGRHLANSALMT